MTIRVATLDDAKGIAKVHVDSWRTTYKGIIPEEFLNNLSYDKRTELWIRNITRPDTNVYVVENAACNIVGFADFWKRDTNTVSNSTDLTSIYLLKEYQGLGLGKKLLEILFQQINKLGYQKVFVDVLEEKQDELFLRALWCKVI